MGGSILNWNKTACVWGIASCLNFISKGHTCQLFTKIKYFNGPQLAALISGIGPSDSIFDYCAALILKASMDYVLLT